MRLPILLLAVMFAACKQPETSNTGLLPDEPQVVEKIMLTSSTVAMRGSTDSAIILSEAVLPASFALLTPTPGNQGQEWSCVAFATTRGVRSIEEYYKTGATSYTNSTDIFSVEYVYNQTKANSCSGGTGMTTCLNLMYYQGVCLENTMPTSDQDGCDKQPDSIQKAEAAKYKIAGYSKVTNTDIAALKTLLYQKHPFACAVIADNGFLNAYNKPDYVWSAATATEGQGSHCVTLIGWDDSKNAFKIMNSWGTTWGDGGYGWIDYDWFANSGKIGLYLYYITPFLTPVPPPPPPPPADTVKPVVTINYELLRRGKIAVKATATDNVGVISMSILVNDTVKATCATASCNYTWSAKSGTYIVKATATDKAGNIGEKIIIVKK